jgi:phosphonate transport system ATP-binding protein
MPVVTMRGVSVRYGGHAALEGIDVEVGAGERVALVGPSGAGKSTFLGLCNRTVAPSSGTVEIFGAAAAASPPGAAARRAEQRRVGMVHQQLHLVGPLRVVHNVNAGHLGSWSRRRALGSLLRPSQLDTARSALDRLGIADKVFERTDRLSGGEQQRVALARLLVQDPDLVVADEPVASLDPARAEEVMGLLCDVVAGRERTLLVSLHDFDLARRRCDRIIGLRAGRTVFDAAAADVTDAMGEALYRIDR